MYIQMYHSFFFRINTRRIGSHCNVQDSCTAAKWRAGLHYELSSSPPTYCIFEM